MIGRWRQRAKSEQGDTLIEILIAVTILGIAFVGILAGLATALRLSGSQRGRANADVVLVSAADSVRNQTYVSCPTASASSYSPSSGVTLPAGWSASNVTVSAIKFRDAATWTSTCPTTDQNVQLVTITAAAPSGGATESVRCREAQAVMRHVRRCCTARERGTRAGAGAKRGVTLVELLISISIMGVILGPLSAGLIIGLKTAGETQTRSSGTEDAQLLSVALPPDIQSAGNAASDVVATPTANTECSGVTNVLRLRWTASDTGTATTYQAAYAITGNATAGWKMTRYFCVGGAAATTRVVARTLRARQRQAWRCREPGSR